MAEGGARRDEPEGFRRKGSLSSRPEGLLRQDSVSSRPEGFLRQDSVSSRQALLQWENASLETCTVMSWLGYGPEIRKARRDAYREQGRLCTKRFKKTSTWIVTGSKAEGLTSFLESDRDEMYVLNSVICLEDGAKGANFPRELTVLRSYSRISYPGHCRLFLERRGTTIHPKVKESFCDDGNGRELLSSDLFINHRSNLNYQDKNVQHDRAGPPIPSTWLGILHTDSVFALRYYCPNILSQWASRPRHWPPSEAVQQVVSFGAFLAPVGLKGSEYQHVEWRVCFNAGENELVNNLNQTQINLYVLLKMIKNDVLKPCKKEVSSYTLKNIVLWIAENNPQSLFHERSLLHWLHKGLDALRVALVTRELPYYMIPERNLMAASGLNNEQQHTWTSTITEMMNEGPRIILRIPKVRQAIIAHPEPLRWFMRRRIEMELLMHMVQKRVDLCKDPNRVFYEADVVCQASQIRADEIINEVGLRMIMEGSRGLDWKDVGSRMTM